jgi:tRNA-dependent cyclodipeptide synthase
LLNIKQHFNGGIVFYNKESIPMPFSQPLRKNSHVLWTISLIQDIHPETQTKTELLQMATDVIASESIEHVTLCVADGLQRFRLMILHNISESAAMKQCEQIVAQWHQDNTEALKKLSEAKKVSTLTWEEFLDWPAYEETVKSIQAWYENNRDFRHDVDGRIRQELENMQTTAKLSDPNEQTKLLKRYLFEECAFQKFASTKGFHYELYKTPMNKAMRRIKKNSDFVASSCMTEIYFTQFVPNKKLSQTNNHQSNHANGHATQAFSSSTFSTENTSFAPFFGAPVVHSSSCNLSTDEMSSTMMAKRPVVFLSEMKPPIMKTTEFIEKALQLIPVEMQAQAIEKLIKFTAQEIIPLSYSKNTLKI